MSALLLTSVIFGFWGLIGFAVLSVFNPRLRVIQGVLVSPSVGIAVTILPVFCVNRLGMPVRDFGLILVATLALLAVLVLAIKRPIFPVKRLVLFGGVLVAALLLSARPMFSYGFDWVSFSNDDMANYSLAAQRFLNHGFFDQPNLGDLFAGRDYSLAYWFMHVAAGVRSGSELMLATVWAATGLNAHQVFMPVIMALHLSLIAGAGSMVVGVQNAKRAPLITMGLLALSPLTTLGTLYQLIGQVGGLALLTAAVTLMYRPIQIENFLRVAIGSVPAALIFASVFVWYPEVLPFFGLGWILYVMLLAKFREGRPWRVLLPALIVGGLVLLALNKYVIAALLFMLGQASGGLQSADLSTVLFPYFLVPSGIAAFWGLIPIAGDLREPFVSLSIAGGLFLFYWLGRYVAPKQISRAGVPVSMLLVMLAMGLLLFFRNNDFGLFKLAMFAQPFLIGVLAIEMGQRGWIHKSKATLFLPPFAILSIVISQVGYVGKSTGEIFGGLNEIPRASAQKVNQQFSQLFEVIRGKNQEGFIADTSNIVLAKFQSLYSQGESIIFPSRNFFVNIADFFVGEGKAYENIESQYSEAKNKSFKGYRAHDAGVINKFTFPPDVSSEISKRTLITTQEKQTIFNAVISAENENYFKVIPVPRNHLVFVHSDLGNHYYFGDRRKIAFYQLENDPMFPGQKFSALGEHLLFFVLGISEKPRVLVELSNTVVKQFDSQLPTPIVQKTTVQFVGRGTGRVFSDPIVPEIIDGVPFVSFYMARDGKQFPNSTKGLMMLYGREVPADQRRITAFGRDISLISEEQFQAIQPPAYLKNFPSDLSNKNLEYSGIYEDGWISEKSFFVLSPGATSKFITVTGSIPQIDDPTFSTVLKVSVNGKEIASKSLVLGNFEFKVPLTSQAPKQRVELAFSKYQTLPGADGRIAPAKINFIGFE